MRRNVIESAIVLEDGDVISAGSLLDVVPCASHNDASHSSLTRPAPDTTYALPDEGISLCELDATSEYTEENLEHLAGVVMIFDD